MTTLQTTFLFSFLSFVCSDGFRFASHYGDHMVLQRQPSRSVIWGFGETGESVEVFLLGKTYETKVTRDSRGLSVWKVILDAVLASGPYQIDATSSYKEKNVKISLKDVFFGDVWVCGGQSNMQFPVRMAFKGAEEMTIANQYTKVRLFTISPYNSRVPIPELNVTNILQQWSIASKDSLSGDGWTYFSAICWMYGRRLYDLYKIPIGLISTNYGGTSIEAWSSPKTLAECGIKNDQALYESKDNRTMHSGLWNAMLYPLLNTTIYGVIWYQGETNAFEPDTYGCTFPSLITSWRNEWFIGTGGNTNHFFPFGFVQLGGLGDDIYDEVKDGYPTIRSKQTAEYGFVPNPKQVNTFMAVTMDLLDLKAPYGSIHARDKTTVAERLLLGARAVAYKENIYWTGPIVDQVRVVVIPKEKLAFVVVHYKLLSLRFNGVEVRNDKGFEVSFDNSTKWVPVDITGQSNCTVSLLIYDFRKTITGVRYAWDHQPCLNKQCAVYATNKDLPSPPFIKDGPFRITHH